jgi:hypothetical protein
MKTPDSVSDRGVLLTIVIGLVVILLSIVWGLFLNPRTLPNWAENVLVAIATASVLKLGDCIGALVALANGKQVGDLGKSLALSAPGDLNGLNDPSRPSGTPDDPVTVEPAK